MGSFTWTYRQSQYSFSGRVSYTDITTIKAPDNLFTIPAPAATIAVTDTSSSPARCQYLVNTRYGHFTFADGDTGSQAWDGNYWTASPVANGATVSFPSTSKSFATSLFFNSNNPTDAYTDFTFHWPGSISLSGTTYIYNDIISPGSGPAGTVYNLGTVRVYLDAPPTFGASQLSFTMGGSSTSNIYAGYTTASVSVDTVTGDYGAKYGGYISKIRFEVGSQYDELTYTQSTQPSTAQTLSIDLAAGGNFRPKVIVTDSRGQTTEYEYDSVTVNVYNPPSVEISVYERTLPKTGTPTPIGQPDDEGESVTIALKTTYTSAIATLSAPTIQVTDEFGQVSDATIAWYSTRNAETGVLSGSVTWANVASGATVYGLITAFNSGQSNFNTQYSYPISVTPVDNRSPGATITQIVAGAFYTMDFLAGGHGIAFGQPSTQDGFFCKMAAHFADGEGIMRALFDFVYPVGSYYETSDTTFDPNDTWGGTWTLEAEGMVHVGAGTNYTAGDTGGSANAVVVSHTHTQNAHSHGSQWGSYLAADGNISCNGTARNLPSSGGSYHMVYASAAYTINEYTTTAGATATNQNTGEDGTGKNMPPYIVVNRWHRTA